MKATSPGPIFKSAPKKVVTMKTKTSTVSKLILGSMLAVLLSSCTIMLGVSPNTGDFRVKLAIPEALSSRAVNPGLYLSLSLTGVESFESGEIPLEELLEDSGDLLLTLDNIPSGDYTLSLLVTDQLDDPVLILYELQSEITVNEGISQFEVNADFAFGEIGGTLLDGSNGNAPLAGVTVTDLRSMASTVSDVDGNFLFAVPTGRAVALEFSGSPMMGLNVGSLAPILLEKGAQVDLGNVLASPVSLPVYTFSSAGLVGRTGPSQAQLDAVYASTSLAGAVTSNAGKQQWTVPASGTYRIEARGAQGGSSGALSGGNGAIMTGDVTLVSGEVLQILVGQRAISDVSNAVGGGGGSFVVRSPYSNLGSALMVAGGGGGTGGDTYAGLPGLVSTLAGTGGGGQTGAPGGDNGNGGSDALSFNNGAGGAGGFLTDGGSSSAYGNQRGFAYVNGGLGGLSASGGRDGGFGGGAGTHATNTGGGAGGGYSGGGAAYHGATYAGGGGGSYNAGTNQSNVSGGNAGNGLVIITYIGP